MAPSYAPVTGTTTQISGPATTTTGPSMGGINGTGTTAPVTVPTIPAGGATTVPSIVSTSGVENEFNTASNQLDAHMNTPDPYAAMFSGLTAQQEANNAANEGTTISSATAAKANQENQLNQGEAATLAGLATRGETSGASRYLPGYQSGLTAGVQNSYNMKYQALDQAERLAIANAHAARNNADTKVLQEQLGYIRQAQQMKAQLAAQAWKEYAFNNLSADQRASLGIQQQHADLANAVANGTTVTSKPTGLGSLWQGLIHPFQPVKSTVTKIPGGATALTTPQAQGNNVVSVTGLKVNLPDGGAYNFTSQAALDKYLSDNGYATQ